MNEESPIVILPPPPKPVCEGLEWRNTAATPEDMPEMAAYCRKLKQYLPDRLIKKGISICATCVLYKPVSEKRR